MKKNIITALVVICSFVNSAFSQKLNEPKLVGTWRAGDYDYSEFLDNTVAVLSNIVKNNPNSKAIARICSNARMSKALVSSVGFPLSFTNSMEHWGISSDQVYFARSSKCANQSKVVFDQYWFVPQGSNIDCDEIILAKKVTYQLISVDYHNNEESLSSKKEFAKKTKEFINELKNNPKAEGFIVAFWNNKFINLHIKDALQQIKGENINASRYEIIRKKITPDHYPEFITVTITE